MRASYDDMRIPSLAPPLPPVATPVNWKDGDDVIIPASITDPTVLKSKFPKGFRELKPYLRHTPQPNK